MSTVRKYQPYYTFEDYRQWKGDWELWYGTAVAMSPSPFGPHERAVSELSFQIQNSIRKLGCNCSVYTGLDWIVQADTVVRPDVMIVCGAQPERHLERAPIMTIEILSDSTAEKDRHAKRELYETNQVKHYLIADLEDQTILWLELQSNGKYEDVSSRISRSGEFSVPLEDDCFIEFECKSAFASSAPE